MAGGINLYLYASCNAINLTDFFGLRGGGGFDPGQSPPDPSTDRDPRTPWLPENLQHRSENCPPYYYVSVNTNRGNRAEGLIPLVKEEKKSISKCEEEITCYYSDKIMVVYDWATKKKGG